MDPADIEAALGPEAAQVARKQLGQSESGVTLVKERAFDGYVGPGVFRKELLPLPPLGRAAPLGTLLRPGSLGLDSAGPLVPLQPDESPGPGL